MKAVTASLALALVPLVAATGRPTVEPCQDAYVPFESRGCYADAASDALIHRSMADQNNMTIEKCTAECKSNNYRFAGLKYWGVCYCGSSLEEEKVDNSECHQPCSGNKEQICGGDHFLSVYEDPTFPKAIVDVSVDDYEPLGCYNDDADTCRALHWDVHIEPADFTTNACLDACRKEGFPYAGTEYGGECWCGTSIGVENVKEDDGECDMPCLGDDSMTCGGSRRMNLYYAKDLDSSQPCGYTPPTTTTATTTTTTTAGVTTTNPPVVTTTATTTTTAPVCTITETNPPECEYKCGNWCAPSLPDWTDKQQCLIAAKTCALQLTSCFKTAGWPGVQQCFEFGKYCLQVAQFCSSGSDCYAGSNKCNKKGCWNKYKPINVKPPTTTTKTTACPTTMVSTTTKATTTTAAQPTTTACPPEPTNICKQPTSDKWGYGLGKPVAGIPLPVVGCNDIKSDFDKNPFKFYTEADSRRCPSFSWNKRPNVCVEACEEQYEECKDNYVHGCKNNSNGHGHGPRDKHHRRDAAEEGVEIERRTPGKKNYRTDECATSDSRSEWSKKGADLFKCWGKGANTYNAANSRCKAQYNDCLAINKKVNPGDSCQVYCQK